MKTVELTDNEILLLTQALTNEVRAEQQLKQITGGNAGDVKPYLDLKVKLIQASNTESKPTLPEDWDKDEDIH